MKVNFNLLLTSLAIKTALTETKPTPGNFSKPAILDWPCPWTTTCETTFDASTGKFSRQANPSKDTFDELCDWRKLEPPPQIPVQIINGYCNTYECDNAHVKITTYRSSAEIVRVSDPFFESNYLSAVVDAGLVQIDKNGTLRPNTLFNAFTRSYYGVYSDKAYTYGGPGILPCPERHHEFDGKGILVGIPENAFTTNGCVRIWTTPLTPKDSAYDIFAPHDINEKDLTFCNKPTHKPKEKHFLNIDLDKEQEEILIPCISVAFLCGLSVLIKEFLYPQIREYLSQTNNNQQLNINN